MAEGEEEYLRALLLLPRRAVGSDGYKKRTDKSGARGRRNGITQCKFNENTYYTLLPAYCFTGH